MQIPSPPPVLPITGEASRNRRRLAAGSNLTTLIAAFAAVLFLRYTQDVFVPLVLSVLTAYLLDPLVSQLARLRMPKGVATAAVMVGMIAAISVGSYHLRHQAVAAIEDLPEAMQQVRNRLRSAWSAPRESATAFGKLREAVREIEQTAKEATVGESRGAARVTVTRPEFSASSYLWSGSLGLAGFAGQAAMIAFLVYFLLASGDLLKRKLVKLAGTRLAEKRVTLEVIRDINHQIERFLMIQVLTSVIVAVATFALLWTFGLNQPIVWGIAAGVLNVIPYFGALIGSGAIAVIGFLQFGSIATASYILLGAIAITTVEGFLLTPFLMGRAARMNGVAMFVSLLFWSWMWGVAGMMVAVPLTMVIKTISDRVDGLKGIGELLGE